MTTSHDSDLLTIAEATHLLKVSRVTLHRWLRDGRLPAYQVGPRAVRIRRADLQAMMRPAHGGEMTKVKPVQSRPVQTTILPLTDEDAQRGLAALQASRVRLARMRAQRGGVPYAESWPLIRQERAEREQRL
ncbi:MAG: helix-turn-helix domain-containing protein [Chloroflexi bacterium]|nr:helix-turn-helix domain-containing protein [Chloroflexota bacterium]